MSKHTLTGRKLKAIKISGFRSRMSTKTGKKILKKRRLKKRWRLVLI